MENAPVALSSSETCCSRKSDATTCSNSTTPVNIEFTEKESGFSTPVFASSSLPKPPALSAAQGLKDPTAASDEDVSSQLQVERLSVVPPVVPK